MLYLSFDLQTLYKRQKTYKRIQIYFLEVEQSLLSAIMSKVLYILVALFMTIAVISAGENAFRSSSSAVLFTSDISHSLDHEDIIYRHIATVMMKRSSSSKGIPNTPQLYTEIVAQIKARIHTEITSKISASVSVFRLPHILFELDRR